MRDALVIAKGWSQVAVEDAAPVVNVLLAEWSVETVEMTRGGNVGGRRAFAQHLLNGISGDEGDEQEDKTDDQPDDRQGVEDALERPRSRRSMVVSESLAL